MPFYGFFFVLAPFLLADCKSAIVTSTAADCKSAETEREGTEQAADCKSAETERGKSTVGCKSAETERGKSTVGVPADLKSADKKGSTYLFADLKSAETSGRINPR